MPSAAAGGDASGSRRARGGGRGRGAATCSGAPAALDRGRAADGTSSRGERGAASGERGAASLGRAHRNSFTRKGGAHDAPRDQHSVL